MGKLGILWEIDRATGQFVAAHDLGYQTLVDIDPVSGRTTYRPGMIPKPGEELEFCPDFQGIRNWRASAYHPGTGALYIPIPSDLCKGSLQRGRTRAAPCRRSQLLHESSLDRVADSRATAAPKESRPRWASGRDRHRERGRSLASFDTYAVAGRRIDHGRWPRRHRRWRPLPVHQRRRDRRGVVPDTPPLAPQGFPITYAVDGKQYFAVPVGGGRMPGAPNAMFVFALPERLTR